MIRTLSSRFGLGLNNNDTGETGSRNYLARFSRRNLGNDVAERNQNLHRYDSEASLDVFDDSDDDDDDSSSVYTTITVETIKTIENENKKPLAAPETDDGRKKSTQLFVGSKTARQDLVEARNDITLVSIYAKEVAINKHISKSFLELVRGDERSWEATAVDILRQKARWSTIVLDSCSSAPSVSKGIGKAESDDDDDLVDVESISGAEEKSTYLDLLLSGIVNVDKCTYLHLTSLKWSVSTSFALQSIIFSKALEKLQLDFIDLSEHVPALAMSLSGNKSITCLIASRCGLDDDHLEILLGHLPKGIEELRIFGNKCRAKGLAKLTDHLKKKSKHRLRILDLSFQHIEPHEEFDISLFCEALGGNTTLKSLDLDNDSLDDGHLAHIVAALCRNKTLEELMLNHNKITGMGVAMLATKFGEMKGLKKISMYSNIFDKTTNESEETQTGKK